MKIMLSITLGELIDAFEEEFDIKILVKSEDSDLSAILSDISIKARDKNAAITISPSTRVRSVEKMFSDSFGISVQICNSMGYVAQKDSILAAVNEDMKDSMEDGVRLFNDDGTEIVATAETNEKGNDKGKGKGKANSKNEKATRELAKNTEVKKEDIRIKNLKEKYLRYEKTEKYSDMKKLLTEIETATLDLSNRKDESREKLRKAILETKDHAYDVANVYKKKRFFFILVFTIISICILAGGCVVSYTQRYYEKMLSREINQIMSSNANNATSEQAMLSEKQKALKEIQAVGIKRDMVLMIGIVFIIITAGYIVGLNKYSVTATRFG